ncbi:MULTISPECIES: hypothetical protein [Bacillus]|uniref:hypothetical protein n=1 Tax=Bacillus TaxID=1386 RepID=UPI000C783A0C|nr:MULTISPECIES: hypothetical protein [Bacillus]MCP1159324.1 hypothetical protein [Bacillus infantis]PLR72213.1 hypothetical protein CYJ37_11705 [Bacillus sp. UMB0728]
MKVRIIKSTNDTEWLSWWYKNRIGEEFNVYPDPDRNEYYFTKCELYGDMQEVHILKDDCEDIIS